MAVAAREVTLASVLGEGAVFCPRPPYGGYGILPMDLHIQDGLTGAQLAVAGSMPVICSAGVATRVGLELLAAAGHPVSGELRTYRDEWEYRALIASAVDAGERLVLQHVHPEQDVPRSRYWISRDLLSFLNNKGNLAALVDSRHVPDRRLVAASALPGALVGPFPPTVVKAATNRSSGGGYGVVLCRDPRVLDLPQPAFGGCERVVVEEHLKLVSNWCLHYCATGSAAVTYLGATEQVVDERGRYLGGWLHRDVRPDPEIVTVCTSVVERAVAMGYHGFCGLDAGRTEEGRVVVFDLNFRVNGSTPPLLLFNALEGAGARCVCGRWQSWSYEGSLCRLADIIATMVQSRRLLPIASYSPEATRNGPGRAVVWGLMLGEDPDEIDDSNRALRAAGVS
jgi:hypothetical protein